MLPKTYSLTALAELPRVPRAVALGIFDGVHLGHRAVISRAVGYEDTRAAVFTFSQPSWSLPKNNAWELLSADGRAAAFASLGVEEVIEADFDAIRDMPPAALCGRSCMSSWTPAGCAAGSISILGGTVPVMRHSWLSCARPTGSRPASSRR